MRYIFILLSCIFVISCSTQKDLHKLDKECLDNGGIPFFIYDNTGNVVDIGCIN